MGQPPIPMTPAGTSLAGKTVIVTGGNAGMGYESARQFLTLGASRVVIAARSRIRGQEAVSALLAEPTVKDTNPDGVVEFFELDLDDYESGIRFTQKVKAELPELDVLLCNGGVNIMKLETSASGHERVMQVNCYTHFLIAFELLPLLRATAIKRGTPSHLTIVGSSTQSMHTLGKKPMGESESVYSHFDDAKVYSGLARYSDSKLVVAAFCRELADRVPASEVVVNNPCPGLVATGLDKNLPTWLKPIMFLMRKVSARSVDEGSRTLVHATCVAGPETHGKFLDSNQVKTGAPFLDEPAGRKFGEKLWAETLAEAVRLDPSLKSLAEAMQL